jgi:hypothetical protein
MSNRKEIEVFSLSFMDLICCGLGGIIVIMLIFSTLTEPEGSDTPTAGEGSDIVQAINRQKYLNTVFALQVDVMGNGGKGRRLELDGNEELKKYIVNVGEGAWSKHLFLIDIKNNSQKIYKFRITHDGTTSNDSCIYYIRLITDNIQSKTIISPRKNLPLTVKKVAGNFKLKI